MARRELAYQVVLLAAIGALALLIFFVTQSNLARLGVDSSFDFLWRRAGFEIGQTLIPYSAESTIARAFVVALLNTLVLAAAAIVPASILGLVIGLARLSPNWLAARLAAAYIEIFRNVPALLQIFFWYFVVLRTLPRSGDSLSLMDSVFLNNRGLFLPAPADGAGTLIVLGAAAGGVALAAVLLRWNQRRRYETGRHLPPLPLAILPVVAAPLLAFLVPGVAWEIPRPSRFGYTGGLVLLPEFMALAAGLSMYNATYIGEIVRSGFLSVPRGQVEAAAALGFSRPQAVRLILLPQALRAMIPPLTTVYLNLFKSTSLAAAIAYPDVVSVFVGTVNNLVGQPVAIMAVTLPVYVFVSLCAALLLNLYHRRITVRAQ